MRTSSSFGKRRVLFCAELAGAGLIWRGIADFNFPVSLIIAGLVAIVAVEVRS